MSSTRNRGPVGSPGASSGSSEITSLRGPGAVAVCITSAPLNEENGPIRQRLWPSPVPNGNQNGTEWRTRRFSPDRVSFRHEILMDLTELAARWGIEPSYLDIQGRRRDADEGTIRRIVEALSARENQPASVLGQARQPTLAYQGDGRNCWVLAVQLYGVRSRRNWGHG